MKNEDLFHELNELPEKVIIKKFDLPQTKNDAETIAATILENVQDGNLAPLETYIRLKFIIDALSECQEGIKQDAINAASKLAKGERVLGMLPTIKESGTKWDYSPCNDFALGVLESLAKKSADNLKERQKFLQTIPVGGEVYGEDGVQLLPPIKSSTTTIAILAK